MKGHTTLTLSEIKIDKVPDGYVYLTKGGDWRFFPGGPPPDVRGKGLTLNE